jgi:hypothetical protein
MVYDKMTKGKSTIRWNGNKAKWRYGQVTIRHKGKRRMDNKVKWFTTKWQKANRQ